ncbi:SufE family protein [Iodidimonas muriae]|nr:SufE family protein [Iodidimonas muriae]
MPNVQNQTAYESLDGTTLQDVRDSFELLDDWEDRYRYIIELGRKLPKLPQDAYNEANKVRGCTSQVWLVATPEGPEHRLVLKGDSDAHIVKGLVALMLLIFSRKTPDDILKTDARAILEELDLRQHLSPMRANGLFSMLERIEALAASAKKQTA